MKEVTFTRRTILTPNERLRLLPRKKKKAFKKQLEAINKLQWIEEPLDINYIMQMPI